MPQEARHTVRKPLIAHRHHCILHVDFYRVFTCPAILNLPMLTPGGDLPELKQALKVILKYIGRGPGEEQG